MTHKALRLTAAVLAAVFLWALATLPPRPATASGSIDPATEARIVAGAFHVHSTRSDGVGDRDAIAAAAARAGLQFVVITDHGDGTRPPDPPAYVHGVLCLDAVEISTNGGHVVALDLPAAPYPLGGEARAVVEDVVRLGGMPVAAHPDSAKAELAFPGWEMAGVDVPMAGFEWMNLDSGWRDERRTRLARIAFDSMLRPGPALASLLDRPAGTLSRWDRISTAHTMVGLAGHDAHGGLSRQREEGSQWAVPGFLSAGFASYDSSFATFAVRVVLAERFTGDAGRDGRRLLDATRAGHVYTGIDAIASPAWVDYRAALGTAVHGMGDVVTFAEGMVLTFRSTLPPAATAVLLRDGVEVAQSDSGELRSAPPGPGAYRVEVRAPGWAVPWIVTNPIYLRAPGQPPRAQTVDPTVAGSTVLALEDPGLVEKDPSSTADVVSSEGARGLAFGLASGGRVSQYAALALPLPQRKPAFDRIAFTGRSGAPMRVSVQLRFESAGGARWVHSVYLSPEAREVVVPLDRLMPADRPIARPDPESASSLLFVVDLTNASPGSQGRFEISSLRLAAR